MDRSTSRVLERYTDMLDPATLELLAEAMDRSLPPAIRINTLKTDVNEAIHALQQWYEWELQPVPFCSSGWQLTRNEENVSRTVEHRMGVYYIQEAASMLPVEMFRPITEPWPLVLDMAAAPGGKTTHLISRLNDQGLVIANDSNIQRIPSLQGNLQHWGTMSTVVTNHPGERFGGWFPECFDQVLLDAPCSGEALRTNDRHKSRLISTQERSSLQQRQIKLLSSAFQALRPGGQLVYSTCSLAPEEDEAVLDALLTAYPQQASIAAVDHLLPVPAPGSVSDGRHAYNDAVRRAVRLWPHLYDTSGFFAALILKHASVAVPQVAPPVRTLEKAGYKLLNQHEQNEIVTNLAEVYSFDLKTLLERQHLVLGKHGHIISALPESWLLRFREFPFVAAGMTLGKQSRRGFEPSHELISRFSSSFTSHRLTIDDTQAKIWLAGKNLQRTALPAHSAEELLLLEDKYQRFLGRGKVVDNELKNMLPRWI